MSATATTPSSDASPSWPRRFTGPMSMTAATRAFAGVASGRRPTTSRPSASSSSPRTTTRSATGPTATASRRGPSAGGVLHVALAVRAAAVHGRGVRRAGAVSVLLRSHRRGDRAGHAAGAAREFAAFATFEGGDPRSPGPRPSSLQADPQARPGARRAVPELLALRRRAPARRGHEIEFDEDARWLRSAWRAFELMLQFRLRESSNHA